MTPKHISLAFLLLFSCIPASAENCVGLLQISANSAGAMKDFFIRFDSTAPPCSSAKTVVGRLFKPDPVRGGKKLEGDKPFNAKEAQANLDSAMKDPAVSAKIAKARRDISDENVRLAYEAAVFDDEGFYGARELKLQQLMQQLR